MENILYSENIISNIVLKNIDNSQLFKIITSCKMLKGTFINYYYYNKYLTFFMINKNIDLFINSLNIKIKELFGNKLFKFNYIDFRDNNIDIKGTEKFNNNNYLLAIDKKGNKCIFLRFLNTNLNIYDYIDFINVDSNNMSTSYTGSKDNIILNMNQTLSNHTFTCGCANIFTCSNNNINCSKYFFNNYIK